MTPLIILSVLIGYFAALVLISFWSNKKSSEDSFYTGDRKSPWYIVSFGMIGASLSGVTFLSIPGTVADNAFSYMQMVFGYVFGYGIIAYVLLPLYYKYKVVSIYEYLGQRFDDKAQKTGAFFFLLSRLIGASLRLFLVALVLDKAIFSFYGIPFHLTVVLTIVLIWIYTYKGGIKTVVWTDTFQTAFMLISAFVTVGYLLIQLGNQDVDVISLITTSEQTQIFFSSGNKGFWSFFFTGMFITVVMTGLDQDMMQKNLTVNKLSDARKNMFWLSINLVIVNFVFLLLGACLYQYAYVNEIKLPETKDLVFAELALNHLPIFISIPFVLGTVAAAYSSADSALTSLTTSFSQDFIISAGREVSKKLRLIIHGAFSVILLVLILLAKEFVSGSVIWDLFQIAGLTYGPLLGLFLVGMFSKWRVNTKMIPYVCLLSFAIALIVYLYSEELFKVQLKTSIALISTSLTVLGLYAIVDRSHK